MAKRSLFNQVVLALSLLCAGALLVRFVIAPMRPSVYTDGAQILDEGTWQGSRRVVWEPVDMIVGISTGDSESDAALSGDGRTLYYSAGMPGGPGGPAILSVPVGSSATSRTRSATARVCSRMDRACS